jgi:hypothetical protein
MLLHLGRLLLLYKTRLKMLFSYSSLFCRSVNDEELFFNIDTYKTWSNFRQSERKNSAIIRTSTKVDDSIWTHQIPQNKRNNTHWCSKHLCCSPSSSESASPSLCRFFGKSGSEFFASAFTSTLNVSQGSSTTRLVSRIKFKREKNGRKQTSD